MSCKKFQECRLTDVEERAWKFF